MNENPSEESVNKRLIEDVLKNQGRYTWPEYKERNNYQFSHKSAQKVWSRYAITNGLPVELRRDGAPTRTRYDPPEILAEYGGFEIRKFNTNKDGEITSTLYGKEAPATPEISYDGFEPTIIKSNPYGKPWATFEKVKPPLEELTEHQRTEFEARRSEILSSIGNHTYENKAEKTENWVVVGCAHMPHHNRHLWYGLLKYISDHQVDGFIFAGDALDLKSLSSHDKGMVRDTTLWREYEESLIPFGELHSVLKPETKKVFLYGNHEDRYNRLLKENENSRFGDALLSPERAMQLPENGWQVLRNWREDKVELTKDLIVFHGNRLGDNPAQRELKDCALAGQSAIFFHTHRYGIASNGRIAAYNCGMFGDIDSEAFSYLSWRERQFWQNGFAVVSILNDGTFHVNPIRCSRKAFVLDGNVYSG